MTPAALLDLATRLMPPHRRAWAEAMRSELAAIPDQREAVDFALGCLKTALIERIAAMNWTVTLGRWGVGLVTLATGAFFLLGLARGLAVVLGWQTDTFEQMLLRHHHLEAARDHLAAYPFILLFALLMGASYAGAGLFLIRWRPRLFTAFCLAATVPAVGLMLYGVLNWPGPLYSYVWPFLPLALLVAAALTLSWLDRTPRRDTATV